MGETTHSIDINAPLRAVYDQWSQFEEFPRFMEGVEEVRQDGPRNLFWTARIAGKEKRWEAEILEQIPDHRIVWHSVDGTPNSGEVTFESLDEERTRVTLKMEYEPEGFFEKAGDALGIPSGRAEGDLKRFRDFIEERGTETAGWNGRIEPGENLESTTAAVGIPTDQSSEIEATPSASAVVPDQEMAHFPEVTPINLVEPEDSPVQQVTERSTQLAEEPSPAATEPSLAATEQLADAPDEPQFYRDSALLAAPATQEIARRAYEIYLEQGQASGHELENWLQAEKELGEKKLGTTHSGTGA